MKRFLTFLSLILLLSFTSVQAANTHGDPSQMKEMQSWFGDALSPYVVSSCIPGTSGNTTTGAFTCKAYVKATTGELVYVTQGRFTVEQVESARLI